MKKKTIFISINIVVLLITAILLTFPNIALAEPSWWTQMKRACRDSGGTAANDYETWGKQGCICNGKPSGQRTCPSGSSGGGAAVPTDGATDMAEGLLKGNSQQFIKGLFQNILSKPQANTPEAPAQRGTDDAQAAEQRRQAEAEQKRQADEQAAQQKRLADEESARKAVEQNRKAEEAKDRLLGKNTDPSSLSLMGVESSGSLGLMTEKKQSLKVKTEKGAFGSTAVVPVNAGAPSVGGMQLMVGDDAEKSSSEARGGFDTSGKMKGAKKPAAPRVPKTRPIAKDEKIDTLKAALKKNDNEVKTLTALLAKLKQSPEPDTAAIKDVQQKITEKKNDKKEIEKEMEDLTAVDDEPGAGQQQASPAGRSR